MEHELDPQEVIQTLRKDPSDRNSLELDAILQSTKEIPFFKKYISEGDKDVHQKCCKYMRVEHFHKDETVFLIDSIGTKFYLILQGKAGVYIRLPKKAEELETEDSSLTCVKVLNAGEAFGELALLNNKPRLASIISHDNGTILAVLNKKDFVEILKEKEEAKLLAEMGFFAKMPFFQGWNFNLVKHLYLNVFRVKYSKGDHVFQENTEPNAVFIITQGTFDIQKTFIKQSSSQEEEKQDYYRTQNLHLRGQSKKATTIVRMMSYQPHELFGEEDILNGQEKRTFGAVCSSSHGECIMIKRRDFFLRILKDEQAKNYLKTRVKTKNTRFEQKQGVIKAQLQNYSDYLYNDQTGLKRSKESMMSILPNQRWDHQIVKNYVSQQQEPSSSQSIPSPELSSPLKLKSQINLGGSSMSISILPHKRTYSPATAIPQGLFPLEEQPRSSSPSRIRRNLPNLGIEKPTPSKNNNQGSAAQTMTDFMHQSNSFANQSNFLDQSPLQAISSLNYIMKPQISDFDRQLVKQPSLVLPKNPKGLSSKFNNNPNNLSNSITKLSNSPLICEEESKPTRMLLLNLKKTESVQPTRQFLPNDFSNNNINPSNNMNGSIIFGGQDQSQTSSQRQLDIPLDSLNQHHKFSHHSQNSSMPILPISRKHTTSLPPMNNTTANNQNNRVIFIKDEQNDDSIQISNSREQFDKCTQSSTGKGSTASSSKLRLNLKIRNQQNDQTAISFLGSSTLSSNKQLLQQQHSDSQFDSLRSQEQTSSTTKLLYSTYSEQRLQDELNSSRNDKSIIKKLRNHSQEDHSLSQINSSSFIRKPSSVYFNSTLFINKKKEQPGGFNSIGTQTACPQAQIEYASQPKQLHIKVGQEPKSKKDLLPWQRALMAKQSQNAFSRMNLMIEKNRELISTSPMKERLPSNLLGHLRIGTEFQSILKQITSFSTSNSKPSSQIL